MKTLIRAARTGVIVGLIISLTQSYLFGKGKYYPMSPYATATIFYKQHASELTIFIIAIICWALIGVVFAFIGRIFQNDQLSIQQMAIIHFISVCILFWPLSIASGWYPLTVNGIVTFLIIFLIIYICIWAIILIKNNRSIRTINEQLKE